LYQVKIAAKLLAGWLSISDFWVSEAGFWAGIRMSVSAASDDCDPPISLTVVEAKGK